MSRVSFTFFFFFDKLVELVAGGSVINRAYTVEFIRWIRVDYAKGYELSREGFFFSCPEQL